MRRISAQEARDVSSTGQLVETAVLDGLEMFKTNAQVLFDRRQAKPARFTLVAQQTTDRAARRGLAFQRTPINLIRHDEPCFSPLTCFLPEAP